MGAEVYYPFEFPDKSDPAFMHEDKPAIQPLVCKFSLSSLRLLAKDFEVGEIREDLNAYLASLVSSPVRSLQELIDWNEKHPEAQGGLSTFSNS